MVRIAGLIWEDCLEGYFLGGRMMAKLTPAQVEARRDFGEWGFGEIVTIGDVVMSIGHIEEHEGNFFDICDWAIEFEKA